jgi:hypothetical protein
MKVSVVQDLKHGVADDSSFQRKSIIKEWDGVKTEDFKFFYISTDLGPYFSWFVWRKKIWLAPHFDHVTNFSRKPIRRKNDSAKAFLTKGVSAKILHPIYMWFMNFRLIKLNLNNLRLSWVIQNESKVENMQLLCWNNVSNIRLYLCSIHNNNHLEMIYLNE